MILKEGTTLPPRDPMGELPSHAGDPPYTGATSADDARTAVAVRAPAKVNLFLEITGRRDDGYHDIATLMLAVDLCDDLRLRDDPAGDVTLTCPDPGLSAGRDNLVVRAAELLRRKTGCRRGCRVHLEKRIPYQAGLGGGSSDAAAALRGLNRLWRLDVSEGELAAWAGELGSDVPFFLSPGPLAWCTGRGEIVRPEPLGRELDLVIVCPPVGLSTAEVYGALAVPSVPETGEAVRAAARAGDADALGRAMFNRLQGPAFRLAPVAAEAVDLLRNTGAAALMTGSGSAAVGLCRGRGQAERCAAAFRAAAAGSPLERSHVFCVRSCPSGSPQS